MREAIEEPNPELDEGFAKLAEKLRDETQRFLGRPVTVVEAMDLMMKARFAEYTEDERRTHIEMQLCDIPKEQHEAELQKMSERLEVPVEELRRLYDGDQAEVEKQRIESQRGMEPVRVRLLRKPIQKEADEVSICPSCHGFITPGQLVVGPGFEGRNIWCDEACCKLIYHAGIVRIIDDTYVEVALEQRILDAVGTVSTAEAPETGDDE